MYGKSENAFSICEVWAGLVVELVLDNLGQDVFNVKSGSTYLLGNEAGDGHSGRGIDFKHVDFVVTVLVFRYDIVDADDSVGMKNVVNATGFPGHLFGCFL